MLSGDGIHPRSCAVVEENNAWFGVLGTNSPWDVNPSNSPRKAEQLDQGWLVICSQEVLTSIATTFGYSLLSDAHHSIVPQPR